MNKSIPQKQKKSVNFVQTELKIHEDWAKLTLNKPYAAALMHLLTSRVGNHNAVVASYPTLAKIMGGSVMTVRRSIAFLQKGNWIEVRRVGGTGTTNAYIINDRVAWTQVRDNLKFSLFLANVVISSDEQPDEAELGKQEPLKSLPPYRGIANTCRRRAASSITAKLTRDGARFASNKPKRAEF